MTNNINTELAIQLSKVIFSKINKNIEEIMNNIEPHFRIRLGKEIITSILKLFGAYDIYPEDILKIDKTDKKD